MQLRRAHWMALLLLLIGFDSGLLASAADLPQPPKTLRVAAVQFRSSRALADNGNRMTKQIHDAASNGDRVVVFPECALSGYFEDVITNLSSAQISGAADQVARACREANIWAIIGTPYREGNRLFNSAAVI